MPVLTNPKMVTCRSCGNLFTPTHHLQVYCSSDCRTRTHRVFPEGMPVRECKNCKQEFAPRNARQKLCANCATEAYAKKDLGLGSCVICGREFAKVQPHQRYCSEDCRKTAYINPNARIQLSTGTVGAVTEMLICADLLLKGFEVFRAVSPSCSCDIIALKEGKSLRIEARTAVKQPSGKISYAFKEERDLVRSDYIAVIVQNDNLRCIYLDTTTRKEVQLQEIPTCVTLSLL